MIPSLQPLVATFIQQEKLPQAYADTVEKWFLPMLEEILGRIARHDGTFVIGISGSQGSGKSTLSSLLVRLMTAMPGLRCMTLSIDDFYLTREERRTLGETVHPLLATRGVPGTHDVGLALETIQALKSPGEVAVPRFDKAVDDRLPETQWPTVRAPLDVIILEGWCLSIDAQPDQDLLEPVNTLEAEEDPEGTWRKYVNDAIRNEYGDLYGEVDYLVMLKAPSIAKVYEWRQNQEDRLAENFQQRRNAESEQHRIMSPEQLQRFIQHYERVTRHGLQTLPRKADVVFQLTDRQTIDEQL